jgi:hypothetical protein
MINKRFFKRKTITKLLLFFSIIGLVVILTANYHNPFLIQNSGPWSIGYGNATKYPTEIPVASNKIYSLEKLREFDSKTRFLADPFFLKVKDTFYLFFEHQLTSNPKAAIGLMTSTDGIQYQYKGTVLKEDFHLSYPQVFQYKNEFYMIPESQQANAVLLYKAAHFPFDWKVCDTLIPNIKLKDPTIYLSDTLNIMVASDNKLTLHLYEADSLFGKWKLHKKHKVITGSEARAGGRFFADKKGLLLPIQNCSNGYGFGLSIYRMTFKNGDYTIKREMPFFLKKQTNIAEFNAGMHQFDIQQIGANKYYYVYDGNRLKSQNKKWNVPGALKLSYYDFKFWLKQTFQ